MRKFLIKGFKVFAVVWAVLAGIVIALSYLMIFLKAPSLCEGIREVQELKSPFNLANFVVTLLAFSPSIAAYKIAEYIENKSAKAK